MAKVLLGFMGSGKTTIAQLLDSHYVDMDAIITERIGMPIAQYFDEKGEAAFRQLESQVLAELLPQDIVLSTGGGVILSAENRKLLVENPTNIYLSADFDSLYERIAADTVNDRPLFQNNSKEELKELFESRQVLYQEVATQTIDVSGKSPEQIVEMMT